MAFDKKLLGQILKQYREAKMTRKEFAEKLDMDERSVARIESGERLTKLPTFIEICNILNLAPNELLSGYIKVQEKESSTPAFKQLIECLCYMDSDQIALVLEITKSIQKYK